MQLQFEGDRLHLNELSKPSHLVEVDLHIACKVDFAAFLNDDQNPKGARENLPDGIAAGKQHDLDFSRARACSI